MPWLLASSGFRQFRQSLGHLKNFGSVPLMDDRAGLNGDEYCSSHLGERGSVPLAFSSDSSGGRRLDRSFSERDRVSSA